MTPNPNPSPELKEAITAAIGKADDAFGYSYRMTGLVDGVETHTLFMDGFEPVSFEDRDDGYQVIAKRRNRLRAEAVLAALRPDATQTREAELREAIEAEVSNLKSADTWWAVGIRNRLRAALNGRGGA